MEIRYGRGGLINNGIEKFLEKSAREEFSISCSPTFAVGSRIIFGKWKYFIRSKFEIIEIRSCVRCIVLQTFKEIGRAVKRRREATVDRVILYRSWISIGGMAFVRPIKTFPTIPSQLSRLLRLSRCLLFYYNIFYTTASFSRRVRGTRGLKSEGGRGHLKH